MRLGRIIGIYVIAVFLMFPPSLSFLIPIVFKPPKLNHRKQN